MKDDDRYLDPARNPMIPKPETETGPDFFDPAEGRAPFGRIDLSPAEIAARLNMKYPGVDIVDLSGGRQLIKMADGRTWMLNGKPLTALDPADLAALDRP